MDHPAPNFCKTCGQETAEFFGPFCRMPMSATIDVYTDTGNVYTYQVGTEASAREHAAAIISTGYRSVQSGDPRVLTWWPPHRIAKVKVTLSEASATAYTDDVRAT